MPGIIMENGDRKASYTNHDRDGQLNGINGGYYTTDRNQYKGKTRPEPQQSMTPISPVMSNGLYANSSDPSQDTLPKEIQDQWSELPPEIAQVTAAHLKPLSMLLARSAQQSSNNLQAKILELARMPMPASAVNGTGFHITTGEDISADNINKKVNLLDFAQDEHSRFVKLLVLTQWSRKSDDLTRIQDLKWYLIQQQHLYNLAVDDMIKFKRNMPPAMVPSPDLKTAIEVLANGKAPWMPELGYIPPPPLTAQEVLSSVEELNTILSMRLNLEEYDKTPLQFRDYTIKSGRVTFKVPGEFEIDLTVGEDDPESQFWFIDFRFLFSPSPSNIHPYLRFHVESKVNAVLLKDGLPGCYKILHEMTLNHKISEFRRQAFNLSRGKWIEGLKVEALQRSLGIQYWLDRYGRDGPKSWIILGIHSGRRKDGLPDPRATSRICIRWFRDSKEVKDADIHFDVDNLSIEQLLKTVIAKHISHILMSTYDKLLEKPLFANRELALSLSTSTDEPAESELKLQLTSSQNVTIRIEPITGRFVFEPASRIFYNSEYHLNNNSMDPASDAHNFLQNLRCTCITSEIITHGLSVGWLTVDNPGLKADELKPIFPKDRLQIIWFQRPGWDKKWFIAVSLSMSGERWWLIEIANASTPLKIASSIRIPIQNLTPVPTYSFLTTLHIFAAAVVSHYTNLRALHTRHISHSLRPGPPHLPIRLPTIFIRISELLPSKCISPKTGKAWAKDILRLTFQGLEPLQPNAKIPSPTPHNPPTPTAGIPQTPGTNRSSLHSDTAMVVSEARMAASNYAALSMLKRRIDRDIAFHPESGLFALRLRSKIGDSIIPVLLDRLTSIERLVHFCRDAMEIDGADKTQYRAVIDFTTADNAMELVLEPGNPHIRVLDLLIRVLNNNEGLDGVATLLPLTLPTLRAFDSIETAWVPLLEKGEALVFARALEWYVIRYTLFPTTPTTKIRKIIFEIKMFQRRGEPWWHIRRVDLRDREGDDIDNKLKSVIPATSTTKKFKEIRKEWKARKKEEDNRRKDDDARHAAPPNGQPPSDAAPGPGYPSSGRALPPIGYQPGAAYTGGSPQLPTNFQYSGYTASPYDTQAQTQMYNQRHYTLLITSMGEHG
ncbi:hypothetical protein B7494_g8353 [Chlorociboria aeruginascens]|nr:hypothetical protein B7494_g8353 [Chlorociboria aeruginascens]